MTEKKMLGADSKEPHTDVTVPTFSQLCRGRWDRARQEEEKREEEEERKDRKNGNYQRRDTEETQRENKLDKGTWQGGNRRRDSLRETGRKTEMRRAKREKRGHRWPVCAESPPV